MLSTRHRKVVPVLGLFLVLIFALSWQANLGSDIALAQGDGPYSIWDDTATPAIPSVADANAIEVGVKFQADVDGYMTGIRFYKGLDNTGTHIGNLWSSDGTLLATATFVDETDTGWQQVSFAAPVPISANTTYVASYHTEVGFYSASGGYFGGEVANPPLRALANGGVDGGNGVYQYGATGFPNSSFNATNYWVDVVFDTSVTPDTTPPTVSVTNPTDGAVVLGTVTVAADAADDMAVAGVQFLLDGLNLGTEDTIPPYSVTWFSTSAPNGLHQLTAVARDWAGNTTTSTAVNVTVDNPVDTTPPTVSLTSPTQGSEVTGSVTVSADAIDNVGVVGVQFLLDGANLGAEDTAPPYTMDWDSTTVANGPHTLTALARDAAGNTASSEVSVAVVPLGANCPCSIWDDTVTPTYPSFSDASAIEVGVKFQTDVDGNITGVRFYKGSLNTGTHIGNLWSSDGMLLASATFVDETASGWQQVDFATPVPVMANTTYMASYHTEAGGYAADLGYFGSEVANPPLRALANGGVFQYGPTGFPDSSGSANNYWVDVVFATEAGPDVDNNTMPTVTITAPADGATFYEGDTISFSGTASDVEDGGLTTSLSWTSSIDGSIGSGGSFSTPDLSDGVHTITASVTDSGGLAGSDQVDITIANVAPTVDAGLDATINEGDTFSSSGSFTDPGADTWTATVDYGDGSVVQELLLNSDNTFDLSHTYADNGKYDVTITVTDDDGDSGSSTATITVNNVAPTVTVNNVAPTVTVDAGPGATINEGDTFSSSGSFTDPGADTWTATVDYGSVFQELPLNSDKTFGLSQTYADNGEYDVTVTVTDDDGDSGSVAATVTVNNVAPTATFNAPAYVIAGDAFDLSLTDPLDPSSADTVAGFEYGFDCGSGYDGWSAGSSTATCSTSPGEVGDRTVKGKIQDKDGGETEYIATVTILPPSAATDSALCYYDRESDLDGQQFRLVFTPDMQQWPDYKLSASNPGQFGYNVFYTGEGPADFNIVVPEPFVPKGATPVHVYTGVEVANVDGFDCFVPDPASEIYAGDTSGLSDLSDPGGFLYVTVHLDYDLKGTTGYGQDSNDNAVDAETSALVIGDLNDYTFEVNGSQVDSQTIQNVNAFKRIPGIGGLVIDGLGNPRGGVQVELYDPDGQLMVTEETDEDGWYMSEYKHIGKPAEYTVKLPEYGLIQTVELKANKFAEVSFEVSDIAP